MSADPLILDLVGDSFGLGVLFLERKLRSIGEKNLEMGSNSLRRFIVPGEEMDKEIRSMMVRGYERMK